MRWFSTKGLRYTNDPTIDKENCYEVSTRPSVENHIFVVGLWFCNVDQVVGCVRESTRFTTQKSLGVDCWHGGK